MSKYEHYNIPKPIWNELERLFGQKEAIKIIEKNRLYKELYWIVVVKKLENRLNRKLPKQMPMLVGVVLLLVILFILFGN